MTASREDELMNAVAYLDVHAVAELLAAGADPDHERTGDERPEHQPTTPLRMVVFRLSDCDLDDAGFRALAAIARLLLQHGADPAPALALAELRHGAYDPDAPPGPFMDVWHLLARAARR